jgi:signal transduction histidine kinase
MRDDGLVHMRAHLDPGRARAIAVGSSVLLALLAVAMVALRLANQGQTVDTWWMGNLVIGGGLGVMGAVLVFKVPSSPIGWLMLIGGLCQLTVGVGREWTVFAVATSEPPRAGAVFTAWLSTWLFLPSIATLPLVLLVFPDGRLPSRRWRPVPIAVVAGTIVGCVTMAVTPGPFTEDLPTLVNPLGIDAPVVDAASGLAVLTLIVSVFLAIASLVVRTRRASGIERQQLRAVSFAGSLLGLNVALDLIPTRAPVMFFDWLTPLLLIVFLLSITLAVLRYRLWDIDVLISYSLVYGVLTLILGSAYVGLVAVTGRAGDQPVALGPSLLAAALVATVFAPLRDRLQRGIDRRLYGDRSDPNQALRQLGASLEDPTSQQSVLDDVTRSVAASLRLGSVAIRLPDEGIVASTGSARSPVHEVPLLFRSDDVGALVVSARPGGSVGRREQETLATLAPSVAAVVHAVAVGNALQQSRQALVTMREEERRRVRRDLHDGLGPALASVGMKLDGARLLIGREPDRARALIGQLGQDIRTTIADIRRLVYDLRPPALDEIGLVAAIEEQVASFTGPTEGDGYLDVLLHVGDPLPDLSAAVEVAVYRIISEGLSNVARHGHASQCRVTLEAGSSEALRVVIDDDGWGIGSGAREGVGLRSMAERAAELGGTCRIVASPAGGTRVLASLPLVGEHVESGR